MKVARHVYVYALGLWAGAALFFGAVVAPGAFRVLATSGAPSPRAAAGDLVTYALTRLQFAGVVAVLLAAACSLVLHRAGGASRARTTSRFASLGFALTSIACSGYLSSRMLSLRLQMPAPIDQIPAEDPLRISFNTFHKGSTALFSLAILAALLALAVRPEGETA